MARRRNHTEEQPGASWTPTRAAEDPILNSPYGELLRHWSNPDRPRRLFFCQIEAAVVCAPNLTVKNRLQVLRPESPDNYYDAFGLVPPAYREHLNCGRVLVTNWHVLAPAGEHSEGGASYRVVNKGEESDEAFARNRLGDLAERIPLLVFNDEGHHCCRPRPDLPEDGKDLTPEEKEALEQDREEARVWLTGLDRINNCGPAGKGRRGILACVDLSATRSISPVPATRKAARSPGW